MDESNGFRVSVSKVVFHKSFDHFILMLICVGAFMLALDNPLWDPESQAKKIIWGIDVFMTGFDVSQNQDLSVLGHTSPTGAKKL